MADLGISAVSFWRGGVGFSAMMAAMARMLRNTTERELEETGRRLFEEQLAPLVYADARRLVEAHRAQGHTLAIVSAATRYQAEPAARDFGIDDLLCTQPCHDALVRTSSWAPQPPGGEADWLRTRSRLRL